MRNNLHAPSYVLVYLLYSTHPAIQRTGRFIEIETPRIAEDLLLSNARLRGYLVRLQQAGLIADLTFRYRYATLQIRLPKGMQIIGEADGEYQSNKNR